MDKPAAVRADKKLRQHYFVARELQITVALLVVLALLGGAFLQSVATALNEYLGFTTSALTVFLTLGYIAIVAILAIFFAHRFVGPFKRLEYEMRIVANGSLDKRLTIRTRDDLHVRNFVAYVNEFIENFENMSKDYNKVHSTLSLQMADIIKRMEKGQYNPEEIKEAIKTLHKQMHALREKW